MEEVPRRTSRAPFAFPCFMLIIDRFGGKGAFSLPGATWDHFRCTVEPSPGHTRCWFRIWRHVSEGKPRKRESPKLKQWACQKHHRRMPCLLTTHVGSLQFLRSDDNHRVLQWRPWGGDNFASLVQVLQILYSKCRKHPFLPKHCLRQLATKLTEFFDVSSENIGMKPPATRLTHVLQIFCVPMICSQSAICLRGQNCTQRFLFEGCIVRPATLNNCKRCPQACPDSRRRFLFAVTDTVAVAMSFAMKNGQICFSLWKFLATLSANQKIASDCGCDAVVPLDPLETRRGSAPPRFGFPDFFRRFFLDFRSSFSAYERTEKETFPRGSETSQAGGIATLESRQCNKVASLSFSLFAPRHWSLRGSCISWRVVPLGWLWRRSIKIQIFCQVRCESCETPSPDPGSPRQNLETPNLLK